MVAFMDPVRGFDAWIAGEEGAELGFTAQDDRTVVIELDQPATYFPSFLAAFVWSVVDPAVLEDSGEENFVLNGAGTGPWQFTEYERDTRFVMEPNPNYYDPLSPSLTRITWPVFNGPDAARTALDLYRERERGIRGRTAVPAVRCRGRPRPERRVDSSRQIAGDDPLAGHGLPATAIR